MTLLTWHVAVCTVAGRVSLLDVFAQLQTMGVGSIPLVAVTSVLSGAEQAPLQLPLASRE